MYKPVLMIHQITPDLFEFPLERFILTFDDGTRDHWEYFENFLSIPTPKIYFIVCSWIDRPEFLSLNQLKIMMAQPDVQIGSHSFTHTDINNLTPQEKILHLEQDTDRVVDWFKANLGIVPKICAYPNNNNHHGIYTEILKDRGFSEFHGGERIDCRWLNDPLWVQNHKLW